MTRAPDGNRPVVVDYGLGNLHSVVHKLRSLGCNPIVSRESREIAAASHLLLPGIGHFGAGMTNLRALDLVGPLEEAVMERRSPILGICLGMQLFLEVSDESDVPGLGWVRGEVRRFVWSEDRPRRKVPHMGWNHVSAAKRDGLRDGIPDDASFYFLHSYFVTGVAPDVVRGTTSYGTEFVSMFRQENIVGVQFHPEKSRDHGLRLIQNFMRTQACSDRV